MSRVIEIIELLEAIIKNAQFEETEDIEIMANQALALYDNTPPVLLYSNC